MYQELMMAQLSSGASGTEDAISLVLPVIRSAEYTHETVLPRYINGHGTTAANLLVYGGITDYVQVHLPDLSKSSDEQLYAASPADAPELRKLDALAFFTLSAEGRRTIEKMWDHPFAQEVLLPDEQGFLHEELGSYPLAKRDPPYLRFPSLTPAQWRTWATKVGGVDHPVIVDGKICVEIPMDVQDKWDMLTSQIA
jgi:hypothetical protein